MTGQTGTVPAPAGDADGTYPQRIGVLGGTFDPPHLGHLWLATLAADEMHLDRVLFMPASQPPHKAAPSVSRATDRLLMTRLAIAGDSTLELCAIELERPGPSFTIDSVETLRAMYPPDTTLFLVMAADSLAHIDTWREPDQLLERIEWIVGPRPGNAAPDQSTLTERFGEAAARIHVISGPALEVSSTDVRARVAAGKPIRYLVPRAVEDLIADRGLYRR